MSTVVDLRGRSFLRLADFTPDEIRYLIDLSAELKAAKKEGREEQKLVGKEIALIFEKDSTRTRCAFEVAALRPGRARHLHRPERLAHGPQGDRQGHGARPRPDVRRDRVPRLRPGRRRGARRGSGVPVYNGLTDEWHPTQMLADFLTFTEHSDKPFEEIAFCYLGDARFNMADSYLVAGAKLGMDVRIASPKSLWPRRGDRRPRARGRRGRERRRRSRSPRTSRRR